MRALILDSEGPRLLNDHPLPEPLPGEALIRVRVAGICSTDLELIKGYAGFRGVLGHEFVGIVEAAPDGPEWLGKRVVGAINLSCRRCSECLGHGLEHCPNRTVLGILGKDGCFADFLTLPLINLHEVPASVSDEEAVFTEPLAAALRLREQLRIAPSSRIAVVGPGRLGLLIAQVLRLDGNEPLVLGRQVQSLELPTRLGLETGLVAEAATDAFDFVVEATGNEAGLAEALRLVKPRGTLALKSTFHGRASVDLTKIVVGEITVVGSRCGPFAPALRLLERRAVDVQSSIDGRFGFDQTLAALDFAARPGIRKALLRFCL